MDVAGIAPWLVFVVIAAGAVGQIVDGAVGMGFGLFTASIMVASGVNPVLAVATVSLAKVGSGVLSGLSQWSFGNVRWRLVIPLVVSGVLGSALGALALTQLSPDMARLWLPWLLLLLGLLIIKRYWTVSGYLPPVAGGSPEIDASAVSFTKRRFNVLSWRLPNMLRLYMAGSISGVVNGLSGAYGPMATSSLMLIEKDEPRYAIGSVNFAEIFVAAASFSVIFLRIQSGTFHWEFPALLIMGSAVGAPVGAYLARHLPPRALGLLVGAALVGINIWAIVKELVA